MAKKKLEKEVKTESSFLDENILDETAERAIANSVSLDKPLPELNGKGVGVYYDETLKKYVLVTLSLSPENDSAIITNKKVLKSSAIAAAMEAEIVLKQLLQKELK